MSQTNNSPKETSKSFIFKDKILIAMAKEILNTHLLKTFPLAKDNMILFSLKLNFTVLLPKYGTKERFLHR